MEIDEKNKKAKIMLHIIMPNQISGPNNAAKLIGNSFLTNNFNFGYLVQHNHAGGRINFSLIKDLKKQIEEFNPDIIHLSGLQSSGFHAVIASRLCGEKKILLTIRGSSRDAINLNQFKRFFFTKIIEPITLMLSHSFYTVCEAMGKRDFLKFYSKKSIGVIHNSAPSIDFENIQKNKLRETYKIPKDNLIVVIVGRMVYDKGITFVAEAINKMQDPDVTFVFIGDGPILEDLGVLLQKQILIGNVILLGKQKNIISILMECDIFLFATLHENLSNALLEACSVGLSIIATNIGGNPEVIKHNKNGILIPPKDSSSIVDAIKYLKDNKDQRVILGTHAIDSVKNQFSQNKMLKSLKNTYNSLLEQ